MLGKGFPSLIPSHSAWGGGAAPDSRGDGLGWFQLYSKKCLPLQASAQNWGVIACRLYLPYPVWWMCLNLSLCPIASTWPQGQSTP